MKGLLDFVKTLPSGEYAECGVYQGDSAKLIYDNMRAGSTLYLFDSFEGHPAPCDLDDAVAHPKGRYSDADLEAVKRKVPLAVIFKGFFPEHFDLVAGLRFCFVNIDCDLYQSTRIAVEFFLPRLVPGGIMRFDDYYAIECPGAKQAIDELLCVKHLAAVELGQQAAYFQRPS